MNEEINKIVDNITKEIQPRKLVLFGSRAGGAPGPDSDVDLCIIEDRIKDKSAEFIKIRKLLGDFILPMDIVILGKEEYEKRKDIWGTVQFEIDKKGIVLYERRD